MLVRHGNERLVCQTFIVRSVITEKATEFGLQWQNNCTILKTTILQLFTMLLFIPCTSQKRVRPLRTLQASQIQHRSLAGYAKHWAHEVQRSEKVISARDLYAGQSVSAAFAAEELFDAKLHFVSAGLGVVKAAAKVPAYDLTVGKTGPGPFCNLNIPYEPHRWWDLLNSEFGKTEPIGKSS